MKLSLPLIRLALVLTPAAFASPLPACSPTSILPCICPAGTSYQQSVTFAVIGAAATDVRALIADFFNTAWISVAPFVATQGPDNKPGSKRTARVPLPTGVYNFTEELTEFDTDPSGSFVQKFNLFTPVPFASGNGSFAGYWDMISAQSIFEYETAITWRWYACLTGHPINSVNSHESALANATNVLTAQGKALGTSVKPFSIQEY